MRVPQEVTGWLQEQGHGPITAVRPVGGGCINHGACLETASGGSFFLKTNSHTPTDMFAREAKGLEALRVDGGPRIPQPYLHGACFLLMEDLRPARPGKDYWPTFGRQLARLHLQHHDRFGFHHDNYIGSTPQPNPWTQDGYVFFAEQRLIFQAELAQQRGLLPASEARQVEHLARRLPDLVPSQPASLIHGDLWSGNAVPDEYGAPSLIDPAAHYGWAEAELAMTTLFGAFPEDFYRAYTEVTPLAPDFRRRFPLYNLYHLLNHLNLFGTGYSGQVLAILRQFR